MKRTGWGMLVLLGVALMTTTVLAQPPGGGERGGRGRRGPGGPGRPGGGPPAGPLIKALDADGDGEISAKEIKNAAAALKKLDKNEDGKITRDELMPAGRGPRGPRGGPGRPGDARGGAGGRGGPGRGGPGGPGGGRGFTPEALVKRIMGSDKNDDGKISKDEAPERMKEHFDRVDRNGDGFVDKAEIKAMAERFQGRGGRGGRPGGDEDRPQRRKRPQPDDS